MVVMIVRTVVTMPRSSYHASDATHDTTCRAADNTTDHAADRSGRMSSNLSPSFTAPNNPLGMCRHRDREQDEEARD